MRMEQKKTQVEDLHARLKSSAVVILTDYKGLSVTEMNALRRQLRDKGVQCKVAKNTLLRRAAEGTDTALIIEHLTGPNAIVSSTDDPVAPAKVLCDFAKDHDKLDIKAGVMGGRVLDAASIQRLSDMPSRETLLGSLLGTLVAVPQNLVRTLNAVPAGLVNVLNAIKDQKEAA